MHEYVTAHWLDLFPEHPNQSDVCFHMGYSTLISPVNKNTDDWHLAGWLHMFFRMFEPEELETVIFLLSTPAARAALVQDDPEIAPFVHDPLLIACYYRQLCMKQYMIRTIPPDVQRFNEALRVARSHGSAWDLKYFIEWIDARPDLRVNSDGVVVLR